MVLNAGCITKNMCGVGQPPTVTSSDLVHWTGAEDLKLCANNKCRVSVDISNSPPLKYQCLCCYKFAHHQCSFKIIRGYDENKSLMTYPSSIPFSGMRWLDKIVLEHR